jgi:hypothetical protein
VNQTEPRTGNTTLAELLPALRHLDWLLEQAVHTAQSVFGADAATDPYRGLYITHQQAEALLTREPAGALLRPNGSRSSHVLDQLDQDSRLVRLQRLFDLSTFDLEVLLIALGPELDLRYERLYGYLQDDVTRRRPTVDLALHLLCSSPDDRLTQRARFSSDAPLIRHGLVRLIPDPTQSEPAFLSHALKLDEQTVNFLLGQVALDSRLLPFCQIITPAVRLEELPVQPDVQRALPALVSDAVKTQSPLHLWFSGPSDSIKHRVAEALAHQTGALLLVADLSAAAVERAQLNEAISVLFREATLRQAFLSVEGLDRCAENDAPEAQRDLSALIAAMLDKAGGVVILCGSSSDPLLTKDSSDVIDVAFPIPDFKERRDFLDATLSREGIVLVADDRTAFAERLRLTPDQITGAVIRARNRAIWRENVVISNERSSGSPIEITLDDLFAASRDQARTEIGTLARKIEPVHAWTDIVLSDDCIAQLREICQRVAHHRRVMNDWGFDRKLSHGKGVTALFSGPSGTGKTMAAEVIANKLRLDLYRIDLSAVVSKYIGETEKNLRRIFAAAENANVILFFDEADALFGKRSEVRDSHDRYANIEISYLLQQMDEYEGLSILATNLRRNMDDAFARRLDFSVSFPEPDEDQRLQIWQSIWPSDTPRSDDLDLAYMARQFRLTGGNIRNIAVSAAFLAASQDRPVSMRHLIHATRREYQKMSKVIGVGEFGEYSHLLCLTGDGADARDA